MTAIFWTPTEHWGDAEDDNTWMLPQLGVSYAMALNRGMGEHSLSAKEILRAEDHSDKPKEELRVQTHSSAQTEQLQSEPPHSTTEEQKPSNVYETSPQEEPVRRQKQAPAVRKRKKPRAQKQENDDRLLNEAIRKAKTESVAPKSSIYASGTVPIPCLQAGDILVMFRAQSIEEHHSINLALRNLRRASSAQRSLVQRAVLLRYANFLNNMEFWSRLNVAFSQIKVNAAGIKSCVLCGNFNMRCE
jgi:hypothetical protein